VVGSIAVASALLAGCAQEIPEPSPQPAASEPAPVLTVEQTESVLAAIGEVLAAADSSRDEAALSARLADPALKLRAAQYTLADRSDGEREPTPLTTEDQVLILGATEGWPRTVMAVTQPPSGQTAPLLIVVRQDNARSPYKLRAWVRLFAGIETPAMGSVEVGSLPLEKDAEGLRATPADTLTWYGDLLTTGSESEHADAFEEDPYVTALQAEVETGRTSLEGIAEITVNSLAERDGVIALQTADGGALVVGQLITSTGYKKTLSGSTLELSGEAGDWLGDGTVPALASVRHDSMVAFYVPPSADGKITVLGADRVLTDASKV
jgi:hypothetical protein